MDDLIIYLHALLTGDATLLAIFTAAGAPRVSVTDQQNRSAASYPRMILEGEEGEEAPHGDKNFAKIFTGKVRLEIVTRQSDTCLDGLAALNAIKAQNLNLLRGNRAFGLNGITGVAVSASYNVPVFRQCSPTRRLPSIDPTIYRHLTTYDVMMNRTILF
jgi:hypothetical protein